MKSSESNDIFDFCLNQYMPVLGQNIFYLPIKNKNFFDVIRFNKQDDEIGLNYYLESLLKNNIKNNLFYNKLTNLEKFLILIDMRSYGIGDIISLIGEDNIQIKLYLNSILQSLKDKIKNLTLHKSINCSNFTVNIGLPKTFILNDVDDIYEKCIHSIISEDEEIDFYLLSKEDKLQILENLPANISNEIINFVEYLQNQNLFLVNENTHINLKGIKFSFFDRTMLFFIKSILNEDLTNFYELEYNLLTKLNLNRNDIMDLNPVECKIFIDHYNEEMKKQEENTKRSTPNFPKF